MKPPWCKKMHPKTTNAHPLTAGGVHCINIDDFRGAGDGNRTHVTSLEGWSSAIELHPHESGAVDEIRTRDIHLGKVALYH